MALFSKSVVDGQTAFSSDAEYRVVEDLNVVAVRDVELKDTHRLVLTSICDLPPFFKLIHGG